MPDLLHGVRRLARSPAFTLVALATLALGVGLNTAMFSLVNVLLLRPLPFDRPETLVRLHRATAQDESTGFSPADYLALRGESPGGRYAGFTRKSVSLSEPGRPAELHEAMRTSADFFGILGVDPALGRVFRPEEEVFGRHRVAILSHALWQDRFHGAPDVVGRTLRVDGEPIEVVGVLPAWANDGRVIRRADVFRPLSFTDDERASRDRRFVSILGRRAETVSPTQENALVSAFGARLAAQFPPENEGSTWRSQDLLESTANRTGRAVLGMLLGLSGFVLLIACSSLANLVLARTIARSQELAVRTALGASRLRLMRPLAMELLVLAAAGGAAALWVATATCDWLSAQSVASGGDAVRFPLDWRVLGFATAASLTSALVFGLAPAAFAVRVDVNGMLKSGARGTTPGRGHQRLRRGLIVGQFAMAMVLLAGTGFFARGAKDALTRHFGWDAVDVAVGDFELPTARYADGDAVLAFQQRALPRLRQLPGVTAVSFSYTLPYTGPMGPRPYAVDGRERPVPGREPRASFNGVTPEYFDVTAIPVRRGRTFTDADTASSPRVVIVNETMARALFPDTSPLGRRIAPAEGEEIRWAEIVGVVGDARAVGVYERPVPFQVYHPLAQEPWHFSTFAVRTGGAPTASVLASVRGAFTALDPDLPVRGLMPAATRIARSTSDLEMLTKLLGSFGVLGLFLAGLGVWGVVARGAAERTGEIGIRVVLGAQAGDVVRLTLGSGPRVALLGVAVGLLGAVGLSRVIASIMPAMEPNGALVLALTAAALVLTALGASYLPARRAASVDPAVALRSE